MHLPGLIFRTSVLRIYTQQGGTGGGGGGRGQYLPSLHMEPVVTLFTNRKFKNLLKVPAFFISI